MVCPVDSDSTDTTSQAAAKAGAMMTGLLARAQEAGAARADLTAEDVSQALLGVAGTMSITEQSSPGQWRRHLAIEQVAQAGQVATGSLLPHAH
jgi:hypothetical protein